MKKAKFSYKKEDGTVSNREILNPVFVKESSNYLKTFEKEEVKYLEGYDLNVDGLTEEEIKKYENALEDYLDWSKPPIKQFLEEEFCLDPKRLIHKAFKKNNISDIQILED